MNQNLEIFSSVISFRKGSSAVGVRAELSQESIPCEIKALIENTPKSCKKAK